MSANIFGSSSKSSRVSNIDKKYVDSKFITLTRILETKLDKSIIESLNIVSDAGGLEKIADKLNIKLDPNAMNSLSLSTTGLMNNGLKYPLGHDFNASNKRIYFLGDPINPQEAVNRRYVDGKRVKNNVGFVPELYGNKHKKGFIVSTNSQINNNSQVKTVFSDGGNEWSTAGIQQSAWVQIQLPFAVSIWKFTIAGKMSNSERWYDWTLEGSNDENMWIILKSAAGEYIGSTIKTCVLNIPSVTFLYYRFYGMRGEATNPGLSHLQIYTVDDLV